MHITDVDVTGLTYDLEEPYTNARTTFDTRGACIVTVETSDGTRGIGEAVVPEPEIASAILEARFRSTLVGADPLDRERLWRELVLGEVYFDRKGPAVAVASGVDIALWDVAGKQFGTPVSTLIGGGTAGDDSVRAYASDLFWDDPAVMANLAAGYVDRGFDAVKAHLGRGIEEDRERVQAMQDAIGDAALMVDVNCGYDRRRALEAGRMLEEEDVRWYEEPLSPYDVEGHADLRRRLDIPIASGENEYTRWGFGHLFDAGAVDIAMPDAMRCGGITEARKICALAAAKGLVVSPHNFSSGVGLAASLHLIAATPVCEWLEFDVTHSPLLEALLTEHLEVDDGRVSVPEGPGLGVDLPEAVVAEYGVET